MWVIISGDGDIDYTTVYGPFDSRDDAEEALQGLPADDEDTKWRTEEILPASALEEYYE